MCIEKIETPYNGSRYGEVKFKFLYFSISKSSGSVVPVPRSLGPECKREQKRFHSDSCEKTSTKSHQESSFCVNKARHQLFQRNHHWKRLQMQPLRLESVFRVCICMCVGISYQHWLQSSVAPNLGSMGLDQQTQSWGGCVLDVSVCVCVCVYCSALLVYIQVCICTSLFVFK